MMGSPAGPGLYDPRNEHDACGVGFVVNIKGRKSHDIIRRRAADPGQPGPSRRGRGRPAGGRRRRLPDPDAGPLLRDWAEEHGLTLPPPGRYAVAMCFLPQDASARDFAIRLLRALHRRRGPDACSAGATCRPTPPASAQRVIETMPVIRQAIVVASPTVTDQDAFERKILTIRKQTLNNVRGLADAAALPG